MKHCPDCGFELFDHAQRCPNCGLRGLDGLAEAKRNRERIEQLRIAEAQKQNNPKGKSEIKLQATPKPLESFKPGVTRGEFFDALKKVAKPIKDVQKGKMPSRNNERMQLSYALDLLKDDSFKAFNQEYQGHISEYSEGHADDAYWETLVGRIDLENIIKMLKHWDKYLAGLPSSQYIDGTRMMLTCLSKLCEEVDRLSPPEE